MLRDGLGCCRPLVHIQSRQIGFERPQANGLISAGDGALVLMARAQRAAHIGVWLLPEQGVIHCDQTSGVMFEDAATLRAAGWRKLMFYEPRSDVIHAHSKMPR